MPDDNTIVLGDLGNSDAQDPNEIVLNDIPPPDMEGDLPDEIHEVFEEMSSRTKAYQIILKQFPEGKGDNPSHVDSSKNKPIGIEYIGVVHGPGKYEYTLQYKFPSGEKTAGGNPRMQRATSSKTLHIGDAYAERHEDYVNNRRRIRMKKRHAEREQIRADGLMNAAENGGQVNGTQDVSEAAEKMINKSMDFAGKLGLMGGKGGGIAGFLSQLTPESIAAMAGVYFKFAEGKDRRIQLMEENTRKDREFMMTMMLKNNQPQGENPETSIMTKMLEKLMDTKDFMAAISPEKQGAVDKLINFAESVLPYFLELAKKPKAAIASDDMVNMAMAQPVVGEMKTDPAMWQHTVNGFDIKYGVDKANDLITVMQASQPWAHRPADMSTPEYYETLPSDCRPSNAAIVTPPPAPEPTQEYVPPEGGTDAGVGDGEDELAE